MPIFKSFLPRGWFPQADSRPPRIIYADDGSRQPVGIENPTGWQHGIFVPIPLTAAQIASPPAEILADTQSTYQLNQSPWTRYVSNGTSLLLANNGAGTTIRAGQTELRYSPFSVTEAGGPVVIQGGLVIRELPA